MIKENPGRDESLLKELAEMRTELEGYKSEVSGLRQQLNRMKNSFTSSGDEAEVKSRRRMLKSLAMGAAGISAATVGLATIPSNALAYTATDDAVDSTPGGDGYAGHFRTGGLANIRLEPATGAKFSNGAPVDANSKHQKGELFVDNDGSLYYCYSGDGTGIGKWRTLSGPNTTGSLILFSAPDRFVQTDYNGGVGYGVGNNSGPVLGFYPAYAPSNNATQVKTYQLAGATGENGKIIPSNATGVLGFFGIQALDGTTTAGFASVWPAGQNFPPTATIDFAASPQYLSTQFTCALGTNGSISVASRNKINIFIDIAGYFI